jgi:hypothetical protein
MRCCFAALLFVSLIGTSYAKAKHAPLPSELLSAKTVFLVNKTGYQNALDTAYDQFQKWGRFSIVQDQNSADIVVVLIHDSGMREGTTIGFTQMNVFLKGSSEPVFETTERYRSKLFGNSSVKECVKDFKKRLESR